MEVGADWIPGEGGRVATPIGKATGKQDERGGRMKPSSGVPANSSQRTWANEVKGGDLGRYTEERFDSPYCRHSASQRDHQICTFHDRACEDDASLLVHL